jgi:hypothetical protein
MCDLRVKYDIDYSLIYAIYLKINKFSYIYIYIYIYKKQVAVLLEKKNPRNKAKLTDNTEM